MYNFKIGLVGLEMYLSGKRWWSRVLCSGSWWFGNNFFLKGDAQGGGGSLRAGFLVQGGGDFGKSSLATGNSL